MAGIPESQSRRRSMFFRLGMPAAVSLALVAASLVDRPAQPADRPAEPAALDRPATVPFQLLASNHMLVSAKINGKGPYQLIFDLGAPITLLSNRAAESAGVIQANAPRHFLFSIRGESEVEKLQAGDLTVEHLPVIVLDHPALGVLGKTLDRPIEGIIGYTFFARYKTTIDYQAHQLTFEPIGGQTVRNLMRDLPDRLLGPKAERHRVLAPAGLWGLTFDKPDGGVDSPGVPIRSVLPGSPAALAGLKSGDLLTSLDGRWTTTIADTYAAAAHVRPGQAATVAIRRDGEDLTLTVTPRAGL